MMGVCLNAPLAALVALVELTQDVGYLPYVSNSTSVHCLS